MTALTFQRLGRGDGGLKRRAQPANCTRTAAWRCATFLVLLAAASIPVGPAGAITEFVGNDIVDFHCAWWARPNVQYHCATRDGSEIPGTRTTVHETTLIRDAGLTKGATYRYACCDQLPSGSDCTTFDPVTTGRVRGSLHRSLTWRPGETYTLDDHASASWTAGSDEGRAVHPRAL